MEYLVVIVFLSIEFYTVFVFDVARYMYSLCSIYNPHKTFIQKIHATYKKRPTSPNSIYVFFRFHCITLCNLVFSSVREKSSEYTPARGVLVVLLFFIWVG